MPDTGVVRVAVVGCGVIAYVHLNVLRRIPGVSTVAVCDRNAQLAEKAARSCGVPTWYEDATDMLASGDVDAVHITTPPRTHVELRLMAFAAGCHVLVEKPAALTVAELDRCVDATGSRGLYFSVIHNGLAQTSFANAGALLPNGSVGAIRSVHIVDSVPSDHEMLANPRHWCHSLPGGLFGETLTHPLYVAAALVPDLNVVDVYSAHLGTAPWMRRDEVRIRMRSSGSIATILSSMNGLA